MQHFQSILIVIGLVAISGVLVHGYLLGRKEKKSINHFEIEADSLNEDNMFHNDERMLNVDNVPFLNKENDFNDTVDIDFSGVLNPEEDKQTEGIINDVIFEKVISTVEKVETSLGEVEKELDDKQEDVFCSTEKTLPIDQQQVDVSEKDTETCEETLISDENSQSEIELKNEEEEISKDDIFIFNVVAKEGRRLHGHALLQFFLTSGFRFGEMSLFHRHQHSDGTGPILFSIANMMLPGTFDPINMKQFDCSGVSFFLSAPNTEISIKEAFDMMLIAVEQMADEFDCIVLNAEREKLTEAEFRNYHKRLAHYL
ncbi:cell division protein ZipA [Psychromonas sp. CD1]|uniref:cell division protein ZipA n=1 Tax=Psychromonas sp. CD1 TaxID=1979839 RepID=UPI000B9B5CB8|nr:cell division protein ZipA [Psychromonas sp. CD1]